MNIVYWGIPGETWNQGGLKVMKKKEPESALTYPTSQKVAAKKSMDKLEVKKSRD